MAPSRKRRCSNGIKKNGECKKKSGPKKSSSRKRRCSNGVKKNGECKKKSGPKKSSSRKRRCSNGVKNKSSRKVYMTSSRCKQALQDKIRLIKREGKYGNKQSVAIAYSMVGKKYPNCKKIFERSRKKKS